MSYYSKCVEILEKNMIDYNIYFKKLLVLERKNKFNESDYENLYYILRDTFHYDFYGKYQNLVENGVYFNLKEFDD